MKTKLPSTKILDVDISTSQKSEILEYVVDFAKERKGKGYIVTPNPEILMYAKKHPAFQEVLNRAQVALPDGVGVLVADRILQKKIIGRITGVDFMIDLCRESSIWGLTVGFLGGRGGVAERTADCLREKFPTLKVVYVSEEWNIDAGPAAPHPRSASPAFAGHIDILFVAFGFPKQEEWIAKNLESLPVTVAMGVGGSFDYISGKVARAPKLVRNIGMEWAFRLFRQPWRIRRQMVLPAFVFEILKERFLISR